MNAMAGTPQGPALFVLGPLAVAVSGELWAVRGQQGQILSALAANWPHPVAVDVLVDCLWPQHPPPSARTALRVILTRLRGRLPPTVPAIVHEGGSYRLEVPPDQFDLARFELLAERAAQDAATAPGSAAEQLIAALDLWRGDAFAPFAHSPRLFAAAVRAEERRRDAEELLVAALLDAGRADSAATWASGLVEAELEAFQKAAVAEARRDPAFQRFLAGVGRALEPGADARNMLMRPATAVAIAGRRATHSTRTSGLETIAVATLLVGVTLYLWSRQG